jgi:hypothetical protein
LLPLRAPSCEGSLTQNTDRAVLANCPIFTSCEHFNVLSSAASCPAAALPSSAHTYRLLIFKEPVLPRTKTSVSAPLTKRRVCQQQRDEIMTHFLLHVKYFLLPLDRATPSFCSTFQSGPPPSNHSDSTAAQKRDYDAFSAPRQAKLL